MSNDLIKYAFTAGCLSRSAHGRTDLEKFDLGLAEGENYFIDYKGGVSNRTGSVFGDFIFKPNKPKRFFTFRYSPDISDTFLILFGDGYIRFIQDNAYVLEAGKTVSAVTKASPGVVTVTGHGFSTGDVVRFYDCVGMTQLNKRTFTITVLSANTFKLTDPFGTEVNTTAYGTFTSGTCARVLTLVSPYTAEDLHTLNATQTKNKIKFTSQLYFPRELTRASDGSWSIASVAIGSAQAVPGGLIGQPSALGSAGMVWGVTAVGYNGEESRLSDVLIESASVNYSATAGSYTLNWSPVSGAAYYNVYRSSIFSDGAKATKGSQLGYVGRAFGAVFTDSNIIPNFAITPPDHYDPFNSAGVAYIDITNGGSSYAKTDTVSVSGGGGSGFVGYPVVSQTGVISAIVVVFPGSGYSSATVSITTATGSGFAGTVVLNPASGNYPAQNTVFQKRQIYASTLNQPLTLWGSRLSKPNNFDVSRVPVENDSYEFDIEAEQVSAISHMIATRGGLLLMSQTGVWLLTGANGGAVTPNSALADPQSYLGVSNVKPLKIDTDVLYVEGKSTTVRMLSYNDFSKVYGGTDVSILASHFFGKNKEIVSWDFAQEPFKLVYGVRADGKMLIFTVVKEQNVFAWTDASTLGKYLDVAVVQEDRTDFPYVITERKINGVVVNFFERFAPRDFDHEEDAVFLDAALTLPTNKITTAKLTIAARTGTSVAFQTDVGVFTSGDVGKIIRAGGGKARVTAYVSSTEVTCEILRDVTQLVFQDPTLTPQIIDAGAWYLDTEFSEVTGLWHLEGQTVGVLIDGSVHPPVTVSGGKITLETSASRVVVGLRYKSIGRTLPLTANPGPIEGKRKRLLGAAVRLHESRGLKCGSLLEALYPFEERTNEPYGEPTLKQNGYKHILFDPVFDNEGQMYFVQEDPLPCSVLGFVYSVEVGDENN